MEEPQDKGAASGSRTDEELRNALQRAVEDAERVIGGSTLPLPFDAEGATVEETIEETDGVEEAADDFRHVAAARATAGSKGRGTDGSSGKQDW